MPKKALAPKKLRVATAAEAMKGLQRIQEQSPSTRALSLRDLLQGFKPPGLSGSIAHLTMFEQTGSAKMLRVSGSGNLLPNGSIEISGHSSIYAHFELRSPGAYAVSVRLQRVPPTHIAQYQFTMDGKILGLQGINPEEPTSYAFAVTVADAGIHTFGVSAVNEAFWFYSATVFQIHKLATG